MNLTGNPVRIGDGPAAVIGDEIRLIPLFSHWMGRCGFAG